MPVRLLVLSLMLLAARTVTNSAGRAVQVPETGRLTGRGGKANLERVLQAAPDLILDVGSVRDTYVDLADRTQVQTVTPCILIDGRF